jgi:hypothetical protein
MSRSIYFFLFYLCTFPIAAYSAEEAQQEYQITVDKLQCLYEHSERLISRSERSVTVQLSEHCEDIAIEVEDSGATRGAKDKETLLAVKLASHQANSDIDVLRLTRSELKCFREEFENLELENKANNKEKMKIRFTANCKTQGAS